MEGDGYSRGMRSLNVGYRYWKKKADQFDNLYFDSLGCKGLPGTNL